MAAILNSATLNSAILGSAILHKNKLHSFIFIQVDDGSHLEFCHLGYRLPFWIRTPCYLLSDSLKNTLTPLWLWLKLIHFDSLDDASHLEICHLEYCHLGFSHLRNSLTLAKIGFLHLHSFILTQLDDGSHLEFCHLLGFRHLVIFSQIQTHSTLTLAKIGFLHLHKKLATSLIHSDSNWWWQPSWILLSWIQPLPSWIKTHCYLLSDSLKTILTLLWLWVKLIKSD